MLRRSVLAVVGLAVALFGGLFGATRASAHNTFSESVPRDGEVLAVAPTTWSVTFAKSVPLESASGSVVDGNGTRVALSAPRHGASDRVVVFALPPNLSGSISARWRLVSTDGHVISGRVAFTVQSEPLTAVPIDQTMNNPESGDPGGAPDVIRVALRLGNFSALVLLGGLLFTEFGIAAGAVSTLRGKRIATGAAVVLAAAPMLQFLIFSNDIAAGQAGMFSSMREAASLTAGGMLLLRMVAGLTLVWLLASSVRTHAAVHALKVPLGIVAITYLTALAYVGHSRSQSSPVIGIPVDVLHTAAISVWLGGLTMLVAVVAPAVDAATSVAAFSRFSVIAQRAVVVIVLTGVIQTLRLHGNPLNMFSGSHGLLLITKVALVAIMLRLAMKNRTTLQRHHSAALAKPERSRELLLRATTTEVLFGFGVLGLTAVLVAVTPG